MSKPQTIFTEEEITEGNAAYDRYIKREKIRKIQSRLAVAAIIVVAAAIAYKVDPINRALDNAGTPLEG